MKSLFFIISITISIRFTPEDLDNFLNENNIHLPVLKECIKNNCQIEKNLKMEINCINDCAKQIHDQLKNNYNQNLKDINSFPKDYCLNEIPQNTLTKKEALIQFAKGPCNPLMLAAGVMSTKLVVEIDCEQLRLYEPSTFEMCGWNSCNTQNKSFWEKVPEKEYLLWIPSISGPLSIFTISKGSNMCFATLIKPHFDMEKEAAEIVIPKKGVKITIFGFTGTTLEEKKCGAGAIQDLLPLPYQSDTTKAFGTLTAILERMGYISGLTYQALPYNFYYSYRKNEFKKGFMKNIKKLHSYTGKKITLIAHSMGNLNMLHNLNLLSMEDKKKYIFNFISIAPPILGAGKAVKILVSGDDEFTTLGGYFGFHFEASIKTSSNQLSLYDLLAKNPFSVYRDQPFMENIRKRIKYDTLDHIDYENSGIPFWPKKEEICHLNSLQDINPFCNIGFDNFDGDTMITFEQPEKNDEYNFDTLQEMINKYSISINIPQLLQKLYSNEIALIKPGVPVYLVFNNSIKTTQKITFDSEYQNYIKNNTFPKISKEEFINGDKTVPTFSAIIPGLKWALEYDADKANPENQPVKFIEFCSLYNNIDKFYDESTPEGNIIIKNEYIGLACKCMADGRKNYDACDHSSMMSDINLMKMISFILSGLQKVSDTDLQKISEIDDRQLLQDIVLCKHISNNIFDDD